MPKHKVFVYGTLRPEGVAATHELSDFTMYNYFNRFPYIVFEDGTGVDGVILEVTDKELKEMDRYENVKSGLFIRIQVTVQDLATAEEIEAFVYVAGTIHPPVIESGDWFSR